MMLPLGFVLLLLSLPWLLSPFWLAEVQMMLVYALAGSSLRWLARELGLISLGHSAWLALGAYGSALSYHWTESLTLSVLCGISLGVGAGWLLGGVTDRLQGTSLTVATLVTALLLPELLVVAEPWTGGHNGLSFSMEGIGPRWAEDFLGYGVSGVLLLASLFLEQRLTGSRIGRAWRASRDAEQAVGLGLSVRRLRQQALAWGGGVTAAAGVLLGWHLEFLSPEAFSLQLSLELLLVGLLGGPSLWGLLGGVVLVRLLPQGWALLRDYLPAQLLDLPGVEPFLFGLILLLWVLRRR